MTFALRLTTFSNFKPNFTGGIFVCLTHHPSLEFIKFNYIRINSKGFYTGLN